MNFSSLSLTVKSIIMLVLVFAVLVLPSYLADARAYEGITGYQFGQGFSCGGGGGGQMFTGGGCSGSPADGQIFSYFVCKFEEIIRDALGKVYCSIVQEATPGVTAALTLAVLFQGMMFLMGVSPFTAKELMIFAGKFSCVLAFALKAEYMIGIGYALFMNIAKEGIVIVLSYLFPGGYSSANDVYKIFDDTVAELMGLASQDSKQEGGQCQNALFSMMVLAAAALPPVAMIGVYFMLKLVYVMLRAVFGYCQGILGVTFLVTLAPIYVSFALFKPTRVLFDKWIQYLISFSFQMVIVFAFLGMAFNIMKKIADDITDYTALVKPYNQQYAQAGLSKIFDMCGICEMDKIKPNEKPKCKSNKVMEIGELSKDQNFLHFVSVKIFAMIIMFYILDIMMDLVPQMARLLAGPRGAAQLGGGQGDAKGGENSSDISLPGEESIKKALQSGAQGFNRAGTTPGAMVSGFIGAIGRGAQEAVKELGAAGVGLGTAAGVHSLVRGGAGQPTGFQRTSNTGEDSTGGGARTGDPATQPRQTTVARTENMGGGVQRASNDGGGGKGDDKNDDNLQNAVARAGAGRTARDTSGATMLAQNIVQAIVNARPAAPVKAAPKPKADGEEGGFQQASYESGDEGNYMDSLELAIAQFGGGVDPETLSAAMMMASFDPSLSSGELAAIRAYMNTFTQIGGGSGGFEV